MLTAWKSIWNQELSECGQTLPQWANKNHYLNSLMLVSAFSATLSLSDPVLLTKQRGVQPSIFATLGFCFCFCLSFLFHPLLLSISKVVSLSDQLPYLVLIYSWIKAKLASQRSALRVENGIKRQKLREWVTDWGRRCHLQQTIS